jgi:hypothetical protein
MCGEIGDEDYSPEERAADRAERFSNYRDKRRAEGGGLADRFDAGPSAFGHQNRARAERQASRHDRLRTGAVSQWSKAEYWQRRTEGVISSALYKSSAPVRRSRVLRLESELRCVVASYTPTDNPPHYIMQTAFNDTEPTQHVWVGPKGRGGRWVKVSSLEPLKRGYARWVAHYELRLSYEKAMLAEEGGTVAEVEIIPGGFFGRFQVERVNKSPATGRVVSVGAYGPHEHRKNEDGTPKFVMRSFNIERLGADAYRAPTDAELATFKASQAAAKKERKAAAPKVAPLINPTDADAERLQAIWNTRKRSEDPREVLRLTQAQYSANSKGAYARCETVEVSEQLRVRHKSPMERDTAGRITVFKIRRSGGRVIVITDKPQKPIPFETAAEVLDTMPSVEKMLAKMEDLRRVCAFGHLPEDKADSQLLDDAHYIGWAYISSWSQFGWTPAGWEALRQYDAKNAAPAGLLFA